MSDIAVAAAMIISNHIVIKMVDRKGCGCGPTKQKAAIVDDG